MKKLKYIIFFIFLSLFWPSCIQALTKEEAVKLVNQYIEKAIKVIGMLAFQIVLILLALMWPI